MPEGENCLSNKNVLQNTIDHAFEIELRKNESESHLCVFVFVTPPTRIYIVKMQTSDSQKKEKEKNLLLSIVVIKTIIPNTFTSSYRRERRNKTTTNSLLISRKRTMK